MDALSLPALPPQFGEPSEIDLLSWVSNRVTPEMLEEIAQNDRGEEAAEHLAALRAQLRARPPLGLLQNPPLEVLQLERWSEPEELRAHWKRLLACTILLRNVGHLTEGDAFFDEEGSAVNVIQVVRSAIAVGSEAPVLATRFLLWLYEAQAHPAFRPFTALGIVLLAAHCRNLSMPRRMRHSKRPRPRPVQVDLEALCAWMIEVEAAARESLGADVRSEQWLFGLNSYESRRQSWISSAQSIFISGGAHELLDRLRVPVSETSPLA